MKKRSSKLSLCRETVAHLESRDCAEVLGGLPPSDPRICPRTNEVTCVTCNLTTCGVHCLN